MDSERQELSQDRSDKGHDDGKVTDSGRKAPGKEGKEKTHQHQSKTTPRKVALKSAFNRPGARKSTYFGNLSTTNTRQPNHKRKPISPAKSRNIKNGVDQKSLTKPRQEPLTDIPIDELSFPLTIEVKVCRVVLSKPINTTISQTLSLALRHHTQSSDDASPFGGSMTTATSPSSVLNEPLLNKARFDLDKYPLCVRTTASRPQRSEILLRYKVSSVMDDATVFEVTIPLTKDRKLLRTGRNSRKTSNGDQVVVEWSVREEGETERLQGTRGIGDLDGIGKDLEARLVAFEKEWREAAAEREKHETILASDSYSTLNDPPTGFAPTPSLIPGLDDDSDEVSSIDYVAHFAPVPRYEHVDFQNRANPHKGTPFETFPMLSTWEEDRSTQKFVDDWTEANMKYEPDENEEPSEEKVRDEEEWKKCHIVDREKLEGLDPGRVQRDFVALETWIDSISLDRTEVRNRLLQSDSMATWDEVLEADESLSKAIKLFEERLGISIGSAQTAYRLLSEKEAVENNTSIRGCDLCGATCCILHEDPNNDPPPQPERAALDHSSLPPSACPRCGGEDCSSRLISSDGDKARFDRRLQALQRLSSLELSTAALLLEQPCGEVDTRYPGRFVEGAFVDPPQQQFPVGSARGKRHPTDSAGYSPCQCRGKCTSSCPCVVSGSANGEKSGGGTFCDRFCHCDENCGHRHRGCSCHHRGKPNCCTSSEGCRCRNTGRACDPRYCSPCEGCRNMQIQDQAQKATQLAISSIPNAGYGLVMLEDANEGDFLGVYAGESFVLDLPRYDSNGYGLWKFSWHERNPVSYWFDLDQKHAIDSDLTGNNLRYINTTAKEATNCKADGFQVTYVEGTHQIAIYATRGLKAGDELFLWYGDQYPTQTV